MVKKCKPESRNNPPARIAGWEDKLVVHALQAHADLYKTRFQDLDANWHAYMRDVRREARRRGLL